MKKNTKVKIGKKMTNTTEIIGGKINIKMIAIIAKGIAAIMKIKAKGPQINKAQKNIKIAKFNEILEIILIL